MENEIAECYLKDINQFPELEFDSKKLIDMLEKLSGMMIVVPDDYRAAIYFGAKMIKRLTSDEKCESDSTASEVVRSLRKRIKDKDAEIEHLKGEMKMGQIAAQRALEMLEHSESIKGLLRQAAGRPQRTGGNGL